MDVTVNIDDKTRQEIETEVKIHINSQLFKKGFITEAMYVKANEMIRASKRQRLQKA